MNKTFLFNQTISDQKQNIVTLLNLSLKLVHIDELNEIEDCLLKIDNKINDLSLSNQKITATLINNNHFLFSSDSTKIISFQIDEVASQLLNTYNSMNFFMKKVLIPSLTKIRLQRYNENIIELSNNYLEQLDLITNINNRYYSYSEIINISLLIVYIILFVNSILLLIIYYKSSRLISLGLKVFDRLNRQS